MNELKDLDKILRSKLEGFEVKGSSRLRFRFYWLIMKKRILGTLLVVILLAALGIALDMVWLDNSPGGVQKSEQNNELIAEPASTQQGETLLPNDKASKAEIQQSSQETNEKELAVENATPKAKDKKHQSGLINTVEDDENKQYAAVTKPEKKGMDDGEKQQIPQKEPESTSYELMEEAEAYKSYKLNRQLALKQMETLPSGPFSSVFEIALLPDPGFRDDYFLPEEIRTPRFGISLSAGPSLYRNTYQVGNLEEGIYKFESLNNNPLEDINAELGITYRLGNWEFGSGITFNQYKASFSITKNEHYLDAEQSYYRQDTIWGYIYDPPILGKPIILGYDSTYIEVFKTEIIQQSTEARFTYLGIPLNLGYRFEHGKYYMKPWVGMNFSFLVSASGEIPMEANGELTELEPDSKYLENFISRLNMGFEAAYAIRPGQYIFINAEFERSLNGTYMNYPLRKKDQRAGISLGYKITF